MQRKLLAFLALSHLVTDINQGVLPTLLPILISTHHISYTAAAGLVFGANITSSIVQPLFGLFSDKVSMKWLMPLGIFLAGLGLALVGIAPTYWLMFVAVAISGIGIAAFHPEGAKSVNNISGDKKATALSIFSTGGNLGFALGPLISVLILSLWGLKGTLALLIPVTIMALLVLSEMSRLKQRQGTLPTNKATITKHVEKLQDDWPQFGRLTAALSLRSAIFWAINTFLPLYLIHTLGQSKTIGSLASTILLLSGAVGTLMAGRTADRFGYTNVVRAGLIAVIPLLMIFVNISNPRLLLILLAPLGFLLFAPFSSMIVLGQAYLPNRMGLASGVTMGLAVSVGGIVAPILGWVADHYSIHTALTTVTILPILAALISFTLHEPPKVRIEKPVVQPAK